MPLDVVDQLSLLGETFVAYVAVEGHTTVGSFLVSFQVGDRVVFQGFVVRTKRARKNTCIIIETHLVDFMYFWQFSIVGSYSTHLRIQPPVPRASECAGHRWIST